MFKTLMDIWDKFGINTVSFLVIIIYFLCMIFNKNFIYLYRIRDKKINKFLKFCKNKKNKKNAMYAESIIMYRFNFYIKYEVLQILFNLKNPIGEIHRYIYASKVLELKNEKFYFISRYNTKIKRSIFKSLFIFLCTLSFVSFFLMFAFLPSGENISDIIIFILYQIIFLMGFIIIPRDFEKIENAEKLIEIVNNSSNEKK